MKEKDTFELLVESYGMEGEGVAHPDGYTFFVPYAMTGERVKVAVDRVKGCVAFAHIIKMLEPSPERRDPDCPLFGKCGGCTMRHLPYDRQIDIKRENVRTLFVKMRTSSSAKSPSSEAKRETIAIRSRCLSA